MWTGWSILKGLAPYKYFVEWKPPLAFLTHRGRPQVIRVSRGIIIAISSASSPSARSALCSRRSSSEAATSSSARAWGWPWCTCSSTSRLARDLPRRHRGDRPRVLLLRYRGAHRQYSTSNCRPRSRAGSSSPAPFSRRSPSRSASSRRGPVAGFVVHRRFTLATSRHYAFTYTTIGVGVAVAMLCVYMVPTGSMSAYIALFAATRRCSGTRRRATASWPASSIPRATSGSTSPLQWKRIHDDFFNPTVLGCLAPFFVLTPAFALKRSWPSVLWATAAVAGALYGVTATNRFSPRTTHVLGESGLVFFFVVGVDALGSGLSRVKPSLRFWARAVAIPGRRASIEAEGRGPLRPDLEGPARLSPTRSRASWSSSGRTAPPRTGSSRPPSGTWPPLRTGDQRPTGPPSSTSSCRPCPATPTPRNCSRSTRSSARIRPKIVFLDPEVIGVICVGANRKRRYMGAPRSCRFSPSTNT